MNRVFTGLGRFSVRYRWLVLATWITGIYAAVSFLPGLSSVTQSDTTSFLPPSAPSQQAAVLASPLQPAGLKTVTVVAGRATPLTAADQSALGQLERKLRTVSGVRTVRDVGLSSDGEDAQLWVLATLKTGVTKNQAQQLLAGDLRSAIRDTPLPSGLQVHLAGPVATSVDNNAAAGKTAGRTQMLTLILIIVLLLIVFRSVLAPLITVVPAFIVVATAGRLTAEAAQHGLQVSQIAQLLMIVLVLGAGTDYGLFLMFRVREEMRGGLPAHEAVAKAVARVGESIVFSAGTVIAALLSLLAATFSLYSGLGVPLAVGIALMLLAGLTLLPALVAIFGTATFWPAMVRPGPAHSGWWGQISARVVRWPVITLVIGVVLFSGLAVAAFGFQPAQLGGVVTAPAGSDSEAGNALLDDHFPQTAADPTLIVFRLRSSAWDNPQVLATAGRQLARDEVFSTVSGPLNPNGGVLTPAQLSALHAQLGPPGALPAAGGTSPAGSSGKPAATRPPTAAQLYQSYRAAGQFISTDGRSVEYAVTLTAGDPAGTAAAQAVPAIRAAVARTASAIGAADSGVAGQAPANYDVSNPSGSDLRRVIPIAIAIIAVLLALVMRSLVAPLYLIASVVLSYFAALGLTVFLFMKLAGAQGLTFFLPFLMFLFLLALGEDYNILVMTRIREEARDLPLRQAVARALGVTGTTVTSAGLILAGTFGLLTTAGGSMGSQVKYVGAGLAVGILMDTFLVRTLLVPSTVVLLGRWNWWPSKLGAAQRLYPGPGWAQTARDDEAGEPAALPTDKHNR